VAGLTARQDPRASLRSRIRNLSIAVILAALGTPAVNADELRPGLLQIRELPSGKFDVMWKTSNAESVAELRPEMPDNCVIHGKRREFRTDALTVTSWQVQCPDGLEGQLLGIAGLDGIDTDVLVRIERLDGSHQIERLTSFSPTLKIAARTDFAGTSATYFNFGISHILSGYDHLLFVLALILLLDKGRQVLVAVTAFTLAHSVTLTVATLGIFRPEQTPIEAAIALSILFLAVELARKQNGFDSMTIRQPWLVAFVFGLLHGFGFAGALLQAGLPQNDVPAALLFFNVGVETGQVIFIGIVLTIAYLLRGSTLRRQPLLPRLPQYGIGIVAAFWTIERVAAFWV